MKKTPVLTKAHAEFNQAEAIAHILTGYILQTLKGPDEQKLEKWVKNEGSNQQLFKEVTNEREIQNNLKELEDTEVGTALNRCLLKIKNKRSGSK